MDIKPVAKLPVVKTQAYAKPLLNRSIDGGILTPLEGPVPIAV